jgi:hypothetical protein
MLLRAAFRESDSADKPEIRRKMEMLIAAAESALSK